MPIFGILLKKAREVTGGDAYLDCRRDTPLGYETKS